MNRAKVSGPFASISARIRSTRTGSDGGSGRVSGGSRRSSGRMSISRPGPECRSASRSPGPTRVCPPRRIGIGAFSGRERECAQPRIGDAIREEEVGGEPVLRARPARFVRPEAMGEEHARVDQRRLAELGRAWRRARPGRRGRRSAPRTDRGGRFGVGRSSGPSARARRALARSPRSSTSARTRAAVLRSSQRSVVALVRPVTTSSARRSAATSRSRPVSSGRSWRALPGVRRASSARQSSGLSRSTPSRQRRREVRHRPAGDAPRASAAARCRRAGPGSRAADRPGDRDRVGRVAVVREGARPARRGRLDERADDRATVARGIEPEPRTTRPAGPCPASPTMARRRAPNGVSSGGPAMSRTSSAPAARKPATCRSPDGPPRVGEESLERAGTGGRARDAGCGRGHEPPGESSEGRTTNRWAGSGRMSDSERTSATRRRRWPRGSTPSLRCPASDCAACPGSTRPLRGA